MNLYLLSQNKNNDYDTFDSLVVCAVNETAAKLIHPYHSTRINLEINWNDYSCWVRSPDDVDCQLIGIAADSIKEGQIICSSFNAG